MPPVFNSKEVYKEVAKSVANDGKLLELVEDSYLREENKQLARALLDLIPQEYHAGIKDIFCGFMTACKWVNQSPATYSATDT